MDGQQIGMIERPGALCLALEARQTVAILRHCMRENLDRHLPPDARVPRAVDLPHPARPEGCDDLIRTEMGTRLEMHSPKCSGGRFGRRLDNP